MPRKLDTADKKTLAELRAQFRRARGWHFAETAALDAAWRRAGDALDVSPPGAGAAILARLAADLARHFDAVPAGFVMPPDPEQKNRPPRRHISQPPPGFERDRC